MGEHLRSTGAELTYYHAKAAAALLMVQLAVELEPGAGGWGMSATDLRDHVYMKTALLQVNQSTFFGKMEIVKGPNGGGKHTFFAKLILGHDSYVTK